jgi:hypothetical protein
MALAYAMAANFAISASKGARALTLSAAVLPDPLCLAFLVQDSPATLWQAAKQKLATVCMATLLR